MGKLLPDRHPNKDFFVLDVREASPKDDMASMEHPVYSLSTKPDRRNLSYDYRGARIEIVPSGLGLPTIFDKDIVLYAISKLTHELNQGKDIDQWVEMTAHEVMVGTNWLTSKHQYKRFEDALTRLRGITVKTNIQTGDSKTTHGFGLIDEFEIDRRDEQGEGDPFGRMSKVRIKLSEWTFRAVKSGQVLTMNPMYFRLRRPIERRLYEIARKHVGDQKTWKIGLENLQAKVGSNSPLKKFRFVIRAVIEDDNIPDYKMTLENDLVTFTHSNAKIALSPKIKVNERTMERAREMAREKGYDFQGLLRDWQEMASKKPPENPDGAFIGFIKKKPSLRQKTLF